MTTRFPRFSPRRMVLGVFLICGLTLAAVPAGAGQGDATIFGVVTDESGAVLPGATVTVSSPALQVRQMVEVTNTNGEYRVTPLPLGTYVVEFTLSGFQTQRREGIRLTAGFVAKVDVQLKVGAVSESITVTGQSPVVDVKTTSAGTQVTQEMLDSAPTVRNGLNSLLTLASSTRPAIEVGRLGGSDPVIKSFGRGNNGWVTVDGVSTTPASEASGSKQDFSYQTIQEATVSTLGSSAEAPTSGMQINLFIKSGGNDFHGEVPYAQTFKWMQAKNVDDRLRSLGLSDAQNFTERWNTGGDLGGRIVRDKLWFYGAANIRKEVGNIAGGPVYPDGSPSQFDMYQLYTVGKATAQLTPTQRLSGMGQYRKQPWQQGPSIRGSAEQFWIHAYQTQMGNGEWQMARGNKLLSVRGGRYRIQFLTNPTLSNISRWVDQLALTQGGIDNTNIGAGRGRDAYRWEGKSVFTYYKPEWILGNHEFKSGVMYDIAADLSTNIDVGRCTPTPPIESLCDPNDEPGNYVLNYRNGVPFQVEARNNTVLPKQRLDYAAAFFQDSWAVNRRLTLNLGVRYANDRAWLPEQCRDAAPAPLDSLYPAQCWPEAHPTNTYNTLVPRLHAAYDIMGDGKTVLKGGWGRFYAFHYASELDIANPNATITTIFTWNPRTYLGPGRDHYRPGDTNLDLNGPNFVSQSITAQPGNLRGLVKNEDLKSPGSDELSLSLERQLFADFAVRVTGVYLKESNTRRLLNTLRPYDSYNIPINNPDPGPDGVLGNADDTGKILTYWDYPASLRGVAFQRPMLINDPGSDANYKSFEIAGTKRLSHRWQMQASYSATKKHIPVIGANVDFNPNAEINNSDFTWEWLTRVTASYLFPWDVQVATNIQALSGDTWGRTVNVRGGAQIPSLLMRVEPIGFRNTGVARTTALQVEKAFRLRGGQRLGVGMNILNLFNSNAINSASTSNVAASGSAQVVQQSGANFLQPAAGGAGVSAPVLWPRLGELLIRYSF